MKPFLTAAVAALAAMAGAASAQPAPPTADAPQRACFRMSQIRNHRIASPDTIYLRVGNQRFYKVTTDGTCASGAWRDDVLIMSTPGGVDVICRPIDLDLSIRKGPGMVTPCFVKAITPMSPDEVAALPRKMKP